MSSWAARAVSLRSATIAARLRTSASEANAARSSAGVMTVSAPGMAITLERPALSQGGHRSRRAAPVDDAWTGLLQARPDGAVGELRRGSDQGESRRSRA